MDGLLFIIIIIESIRNNLQDVDAAAPHSDGLGGLLEPDGKPIA